MVEASRVQKLLTEQNDEINRLRNRIEKLEAALQKIKDLHHGPEDDDVLWIRDDVTYKIVCDTLEGKDDGS
jgi:hypothetical protein